MKRRAINRENPMPTLEITTLIGCPLRCTFCPQDKLTRAYKDEVTAMTLQTFETCLHTVPKYVRIDFSGFAEPWVNRYATKMLEHALTMGYNVAIYTTLQGMHDHMRVMELLQAYRDQVEIVVIHLPDKNNNMRGWNDTPMYRVVLAAFQYLAELGTLPIHFMTMDDDGGTMNIEAPPQMMVWRALNRAGNLDLEAIRGQKIERDVVHETPVMCSFTPFYDQNVLLPNGDVYLCCMDYGLRHRLGNLLRDHYFDLFISNGINALRLENMRRGCDGSICRSCSRASEVDVLHDKHQFWEKSENDTGHRAREADVE